MPSAKLFIAFAITFAFGPAAYHHLAAGSPLLPSAQETMSFTLEGKISEHAGNKLTVSTEGNIIFHVVYNEKTEISRQDGEPASPKDLLIGKRIHVDGDLTESGEIIARKIAIQPEEKK